MSRYLMLRTPSANRVYLADRESVLNVLNLTTGAVEWTRTAVASQGLTPDGQAGPLTLMMLNRAAGVQEPSLRAGG